MNTKSLGELAYEEDCRRRRGVPGWPLVPWADLPDYTRASYDSDPVPRAALPGLFYPPSHTSPLVHILRAGAFLLFTTAIVYGAFNRLMWLTRGWF